MADGTLRVTRISAFLSVLLLLLACACRGPAVRVHTEFDRQVSFETLRSFEFHLPPGTAPRDERIDASLVNARVQRAVAEQLEERGFVRDIRGAPDFLVAHHILLDSRFQIDRYIALDAYGYRSWAKPMRTQSVTSDYEEGLLILDIIDARTKTLIWRGYGETRVDLDDVEARKRADLIRGVVAKMLEGFPPH